MTVPGKPPDAILENLIRTGYFDALQAWMKSLCAPIWWRRQDARPTPYECGTVCFIRTTEALFGVTAAHVHRRIVALRAADPTVWCQIGGHTFVPEGALIDIDDALDVATYHISDVALAAIGAHAHDPPVWPPKVAEGEVILPTGFPSALSESDGGQAYHKFLWFACRAQKSGEEQLGAAAFTSTSIPAGPVALPPRTELYGMSGGPVYRLEEDGLSRLTLIGIVHQYHEDFEFFLIRPLTRLSPTGHIEDTPADVA